MLAWVPMCSSQDFYFQIYLFRECSYSFPVSDNLSLLVNRAIHALVAAGYQPLNYTLHQQVQKYSSLSWDRGRNQSLKPIICPPIILLYPRFASTIHLANWPSHKTHSCSRIKQCSAWINNPVTLIVSTINTCKK